MLSCLCEEKIIQLNQRNGARPHHMVDFFSAREGHVHVHRCECASHSAAVVMFPLTEKKPA